MKVKILISAIALTLLISSCEKDEQFIAYSNLTGFNAVLNTSIRMLPDSIMTAGMKADVAVNAKGTLILPRTAIPIKIQNTADNSTLYNGQLDFKSGIYTLFIAGDVASPEAILKEETDFPFIRTDDGVTTSDSVVNVRFVNLSSNSVPLKIKLASATGNEVDNLPYKAIGNWKAYNSLTASTVYAFQLRDAATDALITTFNFTANSANRFKNVTLVVRGLQGTTSGGSAFGVTALNYF